MHLNLPSPCLLPLITHISHCCRRWILYLMLRYLLLGQFIVLYHHHSVCPLGSYHNQLFRLVTAFSHPFLSVCSSKISPYQKRVPALHSAFHFCHFTASRIIYQGVQYYLRLAFVSLQDNHTRAVLFFWHLASLHTYLKAFGENRSAGFNL